jgi:hypothetical protein
MVKKYILYCGAGFNALLGKEGNRVAEEVV